MKKAGGVENGLKELTGKTKAEAKPFFFLWTNKETKMITKKGKYL